MSVAAVLFCDVRGFTAIAARVDAARVLELLSCYYDNLSPAARERGAAILQCCGDEIFATFTADDGAAAARRALDAAVDMVGRSARLNRELRVLGLPELTFGIGIHVGLVAFGRAGVAGNTVNVGHRHCAAAGGGEIVVSAECRDALGRVAAFEERAGTILKGLATPVSVFVVRPLRSAAAPGRPTTRSCRLRDRRRSARPSCERVQPRRCRSRRTAPERAKARSDRAPVAPGPCT